MLVYIRNQDGKNEGKPDKEVFPIYFNTGAEEILLENYSEIVTSWVEFAINSLDEWLEHGSGAKFLLLQTANLYIAEYKSSIGRGPKIDNELPNDFFRRSTLLNIINEPASRDCNSCLHTCFCAYFDKKRNV